MVAKTKDIETMSDHDHGHVPYILILLHHLDKWSSERGEYPSTYKEKTEFRDQVSSAARTSNPEGGEENFDEAVSSVLKSLNSPSIPSGLKEVFAAPECQHITTASANFWVIAHALNTFVQKNEVLPLPGSIPDMKAQSSDYIALQKLYRSKGQSDIAAVTHYVRKLEEDLNRTAMDGREIEAFCKGAAFVRLMRGRRILIPATSGSDTSTKEAGTPTANWAGRETMVARELGDEDSVMPIYIAMAAFDSGLQHACGSSHNSPKFVQASADAMLDAIRTAVPDFDHDGARERVSRVVKEVLRSGGAELHNIASLTGGMVAQEAIKIITKQYIPADNTVVLDGITSRTGTFRL